ncbi:MAG: hypothetical protein ACI853_002013, partial [Paracoccaceae bacterium]
CLDRIRVHRKPLFVHFIKADAACQQSLTLLVARSQLQNGQAATSFPSSQNQRKMQ